MHRFVRLLGYLKNQFRIFSASYPFFRAVFIVQFCPVLCCTPELHSMHVVHFHFLRFDPGLYPLFSLCRGRRRAPHSVRTLGSTCFKENTPPIFDSDRINTSLLLFECLEGTIYTLSLFLLCVCIGVCGKNSSGLV